MSFQLWLSSVFSCLTPRCALHIHWFGGFSLVRLQLVSSFHLHGAVNYSVWSQRLQTLNLHYHHLKNNVDHPKRWNSIIPHNKIQVIETSLLYYLVTLVSHASSVPFWWVRIYLHCAQQVLSNVRISKLFFLEIVNLICRKLAARVYGNNSFSDTCSFCGGIILKAESFDEQIKKSVWRKTTEKKTYRSSIVRAS